MYFGLWSLSAVKGLQKCLSYFKLFRKEVSENTDRISLLVVNSSSPNRLKAHFLSATRRGEVYRGLAVTRLMFNPD